MARRRVILFAFAIAWLVHLGRLVLNNRAYEFFLLLGRFPGRMLADADGHDPFVGDGQIDDNELWGGKIILPSIGPVEPGAVAGLRNCFKPEIDTTTAG
jgi:hypothetical protein